MISDDQMVALKKWLLKHRDKMKFVVSSVPFVGEVATNVDTWSGPAFKTQRDEIIDHIATARIAKLTFLVGDMHNSYHAKMTVTKEADTDSIVIHELMSSPINQTCKAKISDYIQKGVRKTASGRHYRTKIVNFYNAHSNAMLISVESPKVKYEIFRTKKTRSELFGTFRP